jgi:hypothetical protein
MSYKMTKESIGRGNRSIERLLHVCDMYRTNPSRNGALLRIWFDGTIILAPEVLQRNLI